MYECNISESGCSDSKKKWMEQIFCNEELEELMKN